MRKHFVPKSFNKLLTLRKGSKKCEKLLWRDVEDEEATMDQFYKWLNEEINEIFVDHWDTCRSRRNLTSWGFGEMVHVAIKIERQLQRRSSRYTKSKPNSNANALVEKISLPTIHEQFDKVKIVRKRCKVQSKDVT